MKTIQHKTRRTLPVDWCSHEWTVAIRRKPARRLPQEPFCEQRITGPMARSVWMVSGPVLNPVTFMHTRHSYRSTRPQAFTLIEMLVVIAIIAILAGILLPTLGIIKAKAKIKVAKMEMVNLRAAILAYEKEYNRMPASKAAESSVNATCPDFTFGAVIGGLTIANVGNTGSYQASNVEVMDILTDQDRGANAGHARNPRRLSLFDAKSAPDNNSPGVGPDGVFRDPWGHPYIITIDVNDDNECLDGFYYSLMKPELIKSSVVVWSVGPDGTAEVITGGQKSGKNKDNIVSWD